MSRGWPHIGSIEESEGERKREGWEGGRAREKDGREGGREGGRYVGSNNCCGVIAARLRHPQAGLPGCPRPSDRGRSLGNIVKCAGHETAIISDLFFANSLRSCRRGGGRLSFILHECILHGTCLRS